MFHECVFHVFKDCVHACLPFIPKSTLYFPIFCLLGALTFESLADSGRDWLLLGLADS